MFRAERREHMQVSFQAVNGSGLQVAWVTSARLLIRAQHSPFLADELPRPSSTSGLGPKRCVATSLLVLVTLGERLRSLLSDELLIAIG